MLFAPGKEKPLQSLEVRPALPDSELLSPRNGDLKSLHCINSGQQNLEMMELLKLNLPARSGWAWNLGYLLSAVCHSNQCQVHLQNPRPLVEEMKL